MCTCPMTMLDDFFLTALTLVLTALTWSAVKKMRKKTKVRPRKSPNSIKPNCRVVSVTSPSPQGSIMPPVILEKLIMFVPLFVM